MRRIRITMAVAISCAVLACATTGMVETWSEPNLQPSDLAFARVAAIAIAQDGAQQRVAEDTLVSSIQSVPVTAAYTFLTDEDRKDAKRLRAKLDQQGFDGAVVVRLAKAVQNQRWVPGTSGGFYGNYRMYGPRVYDPGYTVTDTYVQIETSLYNVKSGKLLWSGVSETLNPSAVDKLIDDVVKAAGKELQKQGLVPEPAS